MSVKLSKAAAQTPYYWVCVALLLLLGGPWALYQSSLGNSSSSSSSSSSSGTKGTSLPTAAGSSSGRLQQLLDFWQGPDVAPLLATQAQADVLRAKLQYKHFYVSKSTIPGAGMGVFAKHDMPEGAQPAAAAQLTHWGFERVPQQLLQVLPS
jgi:hypothetical protein